MFGLIAGLAALIIAGGVIARGLQQEGAETDVLRALGASPSMSALARLLGPLSAIVAGAVLSVVVATLLSPLTPIGPVRAVYPHGGFAFDWLVLGIGFALLLFTLGAVTFGA